MGIDIKSRSGNEMNNSMLTSTHFDSGAVDDDVNYRANLGGLDTPDQEAKALSPNNPARYPPRSSASNNSISKAQQ